MKSVRSLSCRTIILASLFTILAASTALGQSSPPATTPAEPAQQDTTVVKLSPGADETARIIGVMPLIVKLKSLPDRDRGVGGGAMSLEALTLRQNIMEQIMGASLDVDGVTAEIDNELAEISEVRSALESRRDHIMNINAVANIVSSGGLGIVSTALQFRNSTANLGNGIGVVSGAASTVLSFLGLAQQRGGQSSIGVAPNMLAQVFDRKGGFHSDYPPDVWAYLNDVPPTETSKETRREALMKRWVERGHIEAPGSVKSEKKIDLMTSSSATGQRKLGLDALADRAAMLSDVRARISIMKRDLSRLVAAVRVL